MTRALFGRPLEPPRLVRHVHFYTTQRHMSSQPSPSSNSFKKPPSTSSASDVEPCRKVWDTCRKYNMRLWTDLRGLKGVRMPGNIYKLTVLYSRNHCMDMKSMKYLDKLEHPFTQSVLDMYIADKKKPLWYSAWGASSMSGASPLPTNVAVRKMQHALRDALAAHGYDREGRRIATGEPSAMGDLHGTLRVGCGDAKALCNAKFVDILAQAKTIIACLEVELQGNNNRSHVQPAPARYKPQAGGYQKKPMGAPMGKPAPPRAKSKPNSFLSSRSWF